jgi:UPF0755 protein
MARRRIKRFWPLTLASVTLAAGVWLAWKMQSPFYAGARPAALVDVPRGAGSRTMARLLADAGVIRSPWVFLLVRALRPSAKLQAGEYSFDQPASVWEVFRRIERGDIFFYEVAIPEGSNIFDIAAILDREGVISGAEFYREARNPAMIRDLAPAAPTLEGYLFPATYRITRHTTAAQLCRDMTGRFRRAWKSISGAGDPNRVVTLASLVEKETSVNGERPLVASVFLNRLDRHMKLDCDPTTIYAALLESRYRGRIHRSDLESRNPYNTYQHEGLPPGPIANPGLPSLEAALRPAQSEFLFFVANSNGSGGHVFTKNIEAHQRAVADYRRGQQKGKATNPARGVSRSRKTTGD